MRITDSLLRLVGATDPNCPNEDALFAYIENKLPMRNRVQLERHFAHCDDCRELLALVGREAGNPPAPLTEEAITEQTNRVLSYIRRDGRDSRTTAQARSAGGFHLSYLKLASIGLITIAIVSAVVLLLTNGRSQTDAAMDALKLALKDARFTEARISGGFPYSRYAVTRGGHAPDDLQFSRAIARLASAEQENAPVNNRLALARVYLARGRYEDAKHALEILNQLSARGVETPEALNDAGVADLQLNNYADAITYFSKALEKSPAYGEALFNKALAEERDRRVGDAIQDWQKFIEESPDEGWKREAKTHLDYYQN